MRLISNDFLYNDYIMTNLLTALVSVIRNFKMGLYLRLSTRLQGKWIALVVLLMAFIISVVSSTYCHYTANGQKCFRQNFLRTCQGRKESKKYMQHLFPSFDI